MRQRIITKRKSIGHKEGKKNEEKIKTEWSFPDLFPLLDTSKPETSAKKMNLS